MKTTEKEKIADEFGKKIGGSRRDQWKERNLTIDDLLGMNNAEKKKFVTKENVWKKPDYQKLKEEGIPVPVIYGRKLIRDSIAKSCTEEGNEETYIKTVSFIRDITEEIRTEDDLDEFFGKIENAGLVSKTAGYYYSESPEFKCISSRNTFSVMENKTKFKIC